MSQPGRQQRRVRFTKADVHRAIKGALAAKLPIAAVRILPTGEILIVPGTPPAMPPLDEPEPNDWD